MDSSQLTPFCQSESLFCTFCVLYTVQHCLFFGGGGEKANSRKSGATQSLTASCFSGGTFTEFCHDSKEFHWYCLHYTLPRLHRPKDLCPPGFCCCCCCCCCFLVNWDTRHLAYHQDTGLKGEERDGGESDVGMQSEFTLPPSSSCI